MVCNTDVNSTVMFQFYLIISWMSTVRWSLPSLHGSILPQGCQQYGEVYHRFMVQFYPKDVNSMVKFTITSWFNTTPRMSRIWWYNLPSHWLSTVQCCLPSLCHSTIPYGCQQDSDIYHGMDVNNMVIFTMTGISTALLYLPWHGCQQCCDIYHDMDVNSAVIFTMIWCRQYCGIYHDEDVNSTVVFKLTWMSTVLWYLPWYRCQQYCDIVHGMDVNRTVIFTITLAQTVMWYLPWHECQQDCDIYHDICCQQYCDVYHDMDVNSTVMFYHDMDVNSTVTFTTWMSTVLWH